MYFTASATCSTFNVGSTAVEPSACDPFMMCEAIGVAALPMSIWPQAMSYVAVRRAPSTWSAR